MAAERAGRPFRRYGMIAVSLLLPLAACSPESQVESALAMLERQEPVFGLIRQHEPGAYQEMRALVDRTIRQGGQPNQQELIQRSREILSKALERRVQTAPDAVVTNLMTLVADQTAHLESNPRVCADLLSGAAGDIRSHIPAEMQERERKLYEDLLGSPNGAQQKVAQEETAGPALQRILSDSERALGLTEADVSTALEGAGPPLQICRANGYLMRRLGQLPPNEGAPIFRLLSRTASQSR
jgi:hypothetical protein